MTLPYDDQDRDEYFDSWQEYEQWSQDVDDRLPPYDDQPSWEAPTDDQEDMREGDIPF